MCLRILWKRCPDLQFFDPIHLPGCCSQSNRHFGQILKHCAVSQMVSHMLVTPSTHSFCFAFVAMHVSQVLADVPTDSLGSYNPFFEDAVQNDPAEARSGLVLTLSHKRNQNVLKEWYGTGINYWYYVPFVHGLSPTFTTIWELIFVHRISWSDEVLPHILLTQFGFTTMSRQMRWIPCGTWRPP